MTFLIVDDNDGMRRLIRSVVTSGNDAVYECSDGCDAMTSYIRHRPDWVLMDIKMSKLDGIAATREITSAFPRAQIVMVSQYDDQEMREGARQAGALAYVLKDDLFAIRKIIGRR